MRVGVTRVSACSGELHRVWGSAILAALCLLAGLGCNRIEPTSHSRAMDTQAVTEDMRHNAPQFGVVLYFTPEPRETIASLLDSFAAEFLPGVRVWPGGIQPSRNDWPQPPVICYGEELAPLKVLPVPDDGHLVQHGHGLTAEARATMRATSRACRLVLVAGQGTSVGSTRQFSLLVHELAVRSGAIIWDSATMECFSPAAWKSRRIDSWTDGGQPEAAQFLFVDAYLPDPNSRVGRAITLGMRRFALPELVVESVPPLHLNAVKLLLRLVAQSLVEQPEISSLDDVTFSISAIRSAPARRSFESQLGPAATGSIRLRLVDVPARPGDPNNAIVQLDFGHGVGRTDLERQEDLLCKFIGGSQSSYIEPEITPEIEAASRRARDQILHWGRDFRKHLPPGAILSAKGPFALDDGSGQEWMWIEVHNWNEAGELEGLLNNDPVHIRRFKAGARVKFPADQVFDYQILKLDGTREGNETGRLMEQQRKQPR